MDSLQPLYVLIPTLLLYFSDVAVPAGIHGDPSLSTWEGWGTETWVGAKGQEMLNFLPAFDLGSLIYLSSRTSPNFSGTKMEITFISPSKAMSEEG